MSTTHLTYAPPAGWTNPLTSQLWYPGVPAASYIETTDATATALLGHGLYTGTLGTAPVKPETVENARSTAAAASEEPAGANLASESHYSA